MKKLSGNVGYVTQFDLFQVGCNGNFSAMLHKFLILTMMMERFPCNDLNHMPDIIHYFFIRGV